MLDDSFAVKIATSSITTLEKRVSAAIAEPVAHAHQSLQASSAVHCDETSWAQRGLSHWLWIIAHQSLCVFTIAEHRTSEVAKTLLQGFQGILHSDRYGGYEWYPRDQRQICWAHLQRDVEGFASYGIAEAALGKSLLFAIGHLFQYWNQKKTNQISQLKFLSLMKPLQTRILNLLCKGGAFPRGKISRQCKRIFRMRAALFAFVDTPGVSPTNNHAEQLLRHSVIWRKTSFGTHSDGGSRFAERILSVVASLKLQRRNIFNWVSQTYAAFLDGIQLPSLLLVQPP